MGFEVSMERRKINWKEVAAIEASEWVERNTSGMCQFNIPCVVLSIALPQYVPPYIGN